MVQVKLLAELKVKKRKKEKHKSVSTKQRLWESGSNPVIFCMVPLNVSPITF